MIQRKTRLHPGQEDPNHHLPYAHWSLLATKHLKRLGLPDSAHCECGSEGHTRERILQICPHLDTVRQQCWPEDIKVGTKLWEQAVELQQTVDCLAATGLRI